MSEISECVSFRLNVYTFYNNGSVIWKHSILAPQGLICEKPIDIDEPTTYYFPDSKTGKLISGKELKIKCQKKYGNFSWGDIHSLVEALSKEWTCDQHKIKITLQ